MWGFGGKLRTGAHQMNKEGKGVNSIQDTGTSSCKSRESCTSCVSFRIRKQPGMNEIEGECGRVRRPD